MRKASHWATALHWYTALTAAMTFALLIAGGLVTSTDSGLAVPDWPLSYGQLFPSMVGGILYEHSHRLIAAVVGLLIFVLAGWLWNAEPRRWVRVLGYSALVAVATQAILGGLTVLLRLPTPISVAHACLAQVVFCLVVCLALVTSPGWGMSEPRVDDPWLRRLCSRTTGLLFLQLFLGAVIRHSGRALILHIACALIVALLLAQIVWRLTRGQTRHPSLLRVAMGIAIAFCGQAALGVLLALLGARVVLATAHVALGALILAGSCMLTLMAYLGKKCQALFPLQEVPGTSLRGLVNVYKFCGAKFLDYLALTKPRLTALALLVTAVGFLMGSSRPLDVPLLIQTLVGAALVGAGANTLNQWAERDVDALMRRTHTRPLPAGRLKPSEALVFGLVASGLGLVELGCVVNALTSVLACITLVSYIGIYTPLKRKTALCTLVGAIPGAMPPLIGWAGARGELDLEAWVLFAMLFLWQLPHFLAIAWVHRDDYARAGFQMLPVVDPSGLSTARQMVLYGLALLPTSLLPTILGAAGPLYFVGAAVVGCWFFGAAVSAARGRSCALATRLFLASVGYLPVVLFLMVIDKTPV